MILSAVLRRLFGRGAGLMRGSLGHRRRQRGWAAQMTLYLAQQCGYDGGRALQHERKDAAEDVMAEIAALRRNGSVAVQADLLVDDGMQTTLPRSARRPDCWWQPIQRVWSIMRRFLNMTRLKDATKESLGPPYRKSNLRAPFVLTQGHRRPSARACAWTTRRVNPSPKRLMVNMVDQRVRKLTPEFMTYTIAKMGLWALTQTSAQALAPRVRVNAIGPGPTLQGEHQTAANFAKQRKATILERGADPKDITAALGYFLNAPAVTGQMLCVDGGQHLAWETPDVVGLE